MKTPDSSQLDLLSLQPDLGASGTAYAQFADALRKSGCTKCALSEARTQIVVDRGNPGAKIMVIGEAPGEKEDLSGKAFVGRAGRTFDGFMKEAGFDTDRDMLIANVAKCRPPRNRPPKPEEAKACMPYLRKQMELVGPKVIILLGATALKHLNPSKKNFSMGEETGKFFELADFPGITFIVFYHPAALLYNSKLKPAMREHSEKLKKFIRDNKLQ